MPHTPYDFSTQSSIDWEIDRMLIKFLTNHLSLTTLNATAQNHKFSLIHQIPSSHQKRLWGRRQKNAKSSGSEWQQGGSYNRLRFLENGGIGNGAKQTKIDNSQCSVSLILPTYRPKMIHRGVWIQNVTNLLRYTHSRTMPIPKTFKFWLIECSLIFLTQSPLSPH